jgi:hypothetical protein
MSKKTRINFPGPDPQVDDMPEELRALYDTADKMSEAAALAEAKRIDEAITAAIQMRVGTGWQPRDMIGRLHRTIYLDGSEVMVLDGVAFMHIGPWKFLPYAAGGTGATREITHLKGADDVLPN